jgi:class 3 adenylate cyclase
MRYRFGECVLDTALYALERQGQAVRLPRRVFQVLAAALEGCIKQVRQAVGDSGRAQQCIHTQHGYGYRFVAAVTAEAAAGPATLDAEALPHGTDLPQAPPESVSDAAHTADHTGTLTVPSASDQSAEPPRPAPERRQLTVLSCALAEAAALATQLEPDDLHDMVQAWHVGCTAIVQQLGSAVAQRAADRVVVYFGAPQAHDDDARRAVTAGLWLLEASRTQVVPGMAPEARGLAVRIGIHTGAVILSQLAAEAASPLAVGATSMIAEGLRERAAPQTVVTSAATAALVRGYVTWQPLAPWTPPGHREPIAT